MTKTEMWRSPFTGLSALTDYICDDIFKKYQNGRNQDQMSFEISGKLIEAGKQGFLYGKNEYTGVLRVAGYAAEDLKKVFGVKPDIRQMEDGVCHYDFGIIFGSIDNGSLDSFCNEFNIDTDALRGKRECYMIKTVVSAESRYLLIAGSDKLGTIYGLLKLSEMLGVSPFVNWMDIEPSRCERFELDDSYIYISSEPSVISMISALAIFELPSTARANVLR